MSRQQQKSFETKNRIFLAAKKILQKQGYDALSIKNICEEAGVSNGSFYHHFKTKDDLLSYYIEEQPTIDPGCLELPKDAAEAKRAIILVYLNYVAYCKELGVVFMSNYYTPKNQALNAVSRTKRPYPIVTVTNNSFSNSTCISRVPFRKREPAQPVPYFSVAAIEASMIRLSYVSPIYAFEPNIRTFLPSIITSVSWWLLIVRK